MTTRPAPSPALVACAAPHEPDAVSLKVAPTATIDRPPESWFMLAGKETARNVGIPTITPFLPTAPVTGAAVVIAAGGGYLIEAMANEAWPQARWLAARGVAAFVLKYRLEPTPADPAAFAQALTDRFTRAADPAQRPGIAVPDYMIDDAAAAMRHVATGAGGWGIDPDRIGFLGFSAGAMIGLELVDADLPMARPAFLGAAYPSMAARSVRAEAPPLFVAMAADDQLYGRQGYGLGMGAPGTTSTGLMAAFHAWLECGGWLGNAMGVGS